jgi:hypothetical protein
VSRQWRAVGDDERLWRNVPQSTGTTFNKQSPTAIRWPLACLSKQVFMHSRRIAINWRRPHNESLNRRTRVYIGKLRMVQVGMLSVLICVTQLTDDGISNVIMNNKHLAFSNEICSALSVHANTAMTDECIHFHPLAHHSSFINCMACRTLSLDKTHPTYVFLTLQSTNDCWKARN